MKNVKQSMHIFFLGTNGHSRFIGGRTRRCEVDQAADQEMKKGPADGPDDEKGTRWVDQIGRGPHRRTGRWEKDQAGRPGDGKWTRQADQEMRRGLGEWTRTWEEDHADGLNGGKMTYLIL